MKIKLNSSYQREELALAGSRIVNTTEDRLGIHATVAYIADDLVDDVLRELDESRTHALRVHDRGRCNAIGSVKRAIAAARP